MQQPGVLPTKSDHLAMILVAGGEIALSWQENLQRQAV
jgi:hypothetical protein